MTILIIIIIIIIYSLIVGYSKKGYYKFYPTPYFLYDDCLKESESVYEATMHRCNNDEDLFYSSQLHIEDLFLKVFKKHNLKNITKEDLYVENKDNLKLKAHQLFYNKLPPFKINNKIKPLASDLKGPCYPSTTAFKCYYITYKFSKIYPFLKDSLLNLTTSITETLIKAGINYPSDIHKAENITKNLFN